MLDEAYQYTPIPQNQSVTAKMAIAMVVPVYMHWCAPVTVSMHDDMGQ